MLNNIRLKTVSFADNHRSMLLFLSVLLTAIILLYPTHVRVTYRPIQSLYLFDSLPLFGTIFYVWFSLLVLLILTGKNKVNADWEKIGLVCLAALVFVAFWAIILPYGRLDYLGFAGQINTIQQNGRLSTGAVYWDFPGLALLGTSMVEITGSGVFSTVNISLLFFPLVISALLYLLFKQLFQNANAAGLAALLGIMGNMYLALAYTFHPNIISFIPLLAFLLILTRNQYTITEVVIMLILMMITTMLYFQTSLLFPLILLGLYVVQRIGKVTPINISVLLLFLIIPIAWQIYIASTTSGLLTDAISNVASSLTEGTFLDWFFFLAGTNVGAAVPQWVRFTRMFWWVTIYGLGTILGLINLLNIKRLSGTGKIMTGGLVGTIILIGFATIVSPGGERFTQYLQYGAFFTVPPLLYFFQKSGRIRQVGLALLVSLSVMLSFPSFLAHNGDVMNETSYSYEVSIGEFLRRTYATGDGLYIVNVMGIEYYYLPKATPVGGSFWAAVSGDIFMISKESYVDDFLRRPGDYTVFLQHDRPRVAAEMNYGISRNDLRWQQMKQKLENGYAQLIYDNGHVQIWKPPFLH